MSTPKTRCIQLFHGMYKTKFTYYMAPWYSIQPRAVLFTYATFGIICVIPNFACIHSQSTIVRSAYNSYFTVL